MSGVPSLLGLAGGPGRGDRVCSGRLLEELALEGEGDLAVGLEKPRDSRQPASDLLLLLDDDDDAFAAVAAAVCFEEDFRGGGLGGGA